MVDRLEEQLRLVSDYARRAFEERQERYLAELASKLRLLLVRSRQNTPLLFEVAAQLDIPMRVRLREGPKMLKREYPDEMSLDEFFDIPAVTVSTSHGDVQMTKRQLICAWAQQLGGAHEDWSVDEALVKATRVPVFIAGMQPSVLELRNCVRTVITEGTALVAKARAKLTPPER